MSWSTSIPLSQKSEVIFCSSSIITDVDLEEDDIVVVDVDVKIEGEEVHIKSERERWSKVWRFFERLPIGDEELSLEELTDDVMQMDNKDTQVEDV
ncbi:unnamed protein product [Lactuca saligna]|uniref:Uncharacterized protein n=1 Tax=Lactuca saligna TaxID=75948 RepID=A0AA35YP07_LACSI|nr:unnamed protein product [Lactuca saligna]